MIDIDSICAIIISYNADNGIVDGISSIKRQVGSVLVVDNGSRVEAISVLKNLESDEAIEVIYNNENFGIAKALNLGIEYARDNGFKWVVTLDQDSISTDNMIENMIKTFNKLNDKDKQKVKILVPEHIEKSSLSNFKYIDQLPNNYVLTEITSGSLVDLDVFQKIGLFEEKLFIDLVDHDFCLRANLNNYKILKVNNAVLLHSLGDTKTYTLFGKNITSSNHSALRRYYMTRNRLYIWEKYKKDFPDWVKHDKFLFINELCRLLLFEYDKLKKLKMIFKGFIDYKQKVFNKINGR